ncbi:MAG: hypothetical protein VB137_16060 [Burkholderia sp.]
MLKKETCRKSCAGGGGGRARSAAADAASAAEFKRWSVADANALSRPALAARRID